MNGLIDGFLAGFSLLKQADATEVPESVAAGAALGGSVGAILPFLLKRYGHRVHARLLDERLMTRFGALSGGIAGGFAGRWLPEVLRQGEKGYRTGAGIFPQTKQSDEAFKGIGTGALAGAGISTGTVLPILFGRLGRRLPRKFLNKMILGRAASGAAIGAAVGGITSKLRPKDNNYHYFYHKSLPGKA